MRSLLGGRLTSTARCFVCRCLVRSALNGASAWDTPSYAVLFHGGGSYGSSLYDSLVDGKSVDMIVCDPCLKARKRLLREVQGEPAW